MANLVFKDVLVSLDNASGTTARLTSYVNNVSISGSIAMLDQAGLDSEEDTFLPGRGGYTVSMNGWVNTTTSAIFGPLVGNRTSVTKSWGVKDGLKWYSGTAWPEGVEFSGAAGELQTWSLTLRGEGACAYNSTAPS